MKKIITLSVVFCIVFSLAACKKNTKANNALEEGMPAPTTVEVTVEETPVMMIDVVNNEIALGAVNFELDKYNLSAEAKKVLEANAAIIKTKAANAVFSVTVEGHCDERGTISYNIALGEKRANEVSAYYAKLGVKMANITTVSYGKERPLCYTATESCHAKNRRAETFLLIK
jgi:peptidoglycan-associated lipoprotein